MFLENKYLIIGSTYTVCFSQKIFNFHSWENDYMNTKGIIQNSIPNRKYGINKFKGISL